jgi:hypothetical protein
MFDKPTQKNIQLPVDAHLPGRKLVFKNALTGAMHICSAKKVVVEIIVLSA